MKGRASLLASMPRSSWLYYNSCRTSKSTQRMNTGIPNLFAANKSAENCNKLAETAIRTRQFGLGIAISCRFPGGYAAMSAMVKVN